MSVRAGPWFEGTYGTVSPTQGVTFADAVIERFRALGVPLKPGNRLERARQVAAELSAGRLTVRREDAGAREWAAEALRTIWEFALIANTAPSGHPPTIAKLEAMLTGAALPRADLNSKGRDTQFELLVAALFAAGGVRIRGEEPDLRFELDGRERGLAVKRVRSVKKLAMRLSKGAAQLQGNGVDGLIVVNVEPFLDGLSTAGGAEAAGRRFDARVAPLHRLFPKVAGKKRVLGVIGAGTVPEWSFEGPRFSFSIAWFQQFRWFVEDPAEQARTDAFFAGVRTHTESRLAEFFKP